MLNLLLGIIVIPILIILAVLGGQHYKQLRRFIFPAIVTIYSIFLLHNFWALTIYAMAGFLSIGYGTPSFNGPNGTMDDEGSAIGAFFYKIFKNTTTADILTRGFVGILISLSMLSIPVITGKWITYLLGSAIIIGIWSSVSWRNFGSFKAKLLGKDYEIPISDVITYAVTSCAIVVIINGWLR